MLIGRSGHARGFAMAYKYKYNGKEWQEELGLNMYDMDMRDYDPAIGRWVNIDPVVHYSQSTYNGYDGNPVFWADPSGADVGYSTNSVTFVGEDAGSFFNALKGAMNGETTSFSINTAGIVDLEKMTTIVEGVDTGDSGQNKTPKKSFFNRAWGGVLKLLGLGKKQEYSSVSSVGPVTEGDLSAIWNSDGMREIVPDTFRAGITVGATAFIGAGQSFDLVVLARGADAGLYFAPSGNANVATGVDGSISLNFSKGNYTGNVTDLNCTMLKGSTYELSGGMNVYGPITVGIGKSYAPSDEGIHVGIFSESRSVGFGLEVGTTGANIQFSVQSTQKLYTIYWPW